MNGRSKCSDRFYKFEKEKYKTQSIVALRKILRQSRGYYPDAQQFRPQKRKASAKAPFTAAYGI